MKKINFSGQPAKLNDVRVQRKKLIDEIKLIKSRLQSELTITKPLFL